jgi:hypothetical protein
LPRDFSFEDSFPTNPEIDDQNTDYKKITFNRATLEGNDRFSPCIEVSVDHAGEFCNTAQIFSINSRPVEVEKCTRITGPEPRLSIRKTGPGIIERNTAFQYEILIENIGSVMLPNIILRDYVDRRKAILFTLFEADRPHDCHSYDELDSGNSNAIESRGIECTLGDLNPGDTINVTVQARSSNVETGPAVTMHRLLMNWIALILSNISTQS